MIPINQIYNEDCLETMKRIDDKSIDMILCDLPYGTTACSWDTIIPFEPLWSAYKRIIKDNGAIVLTASQPFTSKLIMSNLPMFKYCWIWEKQHCTGFLTVKTQPMKKHEDIIIFSKGTIASGSKRNMKYNPQGLRKVDRQKIVQKKPNYIGRRINQEGEKYKQQAINYPKSIINFKKDNDNSHPTQKPVALFEYLIRTYTNEGDLVLDNCAGSFTTAIACIKTNRNWVCIEKEKKYCDVGSERIKQELSQMRLL